MMTTHKKKYNDIQDLLHQPLINYLSMVSEGERLDKFLNLSYIRNKDKNLYKKIKENQKLEGKNEDVIKALAKDFSS